MLGIHDDSSAFMHLNIKKIMAKVNFLNIASLTFKWRNWRTDVRSPRYKN